ncbi:MAG: response regulator [Planctomycetota bacterium]
MPTALVIDDSGASRTLLKGILKTLGISVVEAADGTAGLNELGETGNNIDLILLDWHMEPMDGPTFLRLARENPLTVHIPVIMITAEASRHAVMEAAELGIKGYIVKPFDRQMVADRISALGLKSAET